VVLLPDGGGILDLANHNATIVGLQSDSAGADNSSVNLGTGTLTLNMTDNQGNAYYNGVISGSGGSLVKTGLKTEQLGGNNTYTGTTTVNGGTLEVDGNQPQSPVTVAAGAVLSGIGTVGPTTVFGTLRPFGTSQPGSVAASAGTLSVAGDVTFSGSSAVFAVELDGTGAGQYSQLNASGTVDLGTATALSVTIGYASSSGDTFVSVITSASLVNTFNTVPPGIQDSYTATDVNLSIL
jgi:autotransporter-associated beta strand protein